MATPKSQRDQRTRDLVILAFKDAAGFCDIHDVKDPPERIYVDLVGGRWRYPEEDRWINFGERHPQPNGPRRTIGIFRARGVTAIGKILEIAQHYPEKLLDAAGRIAASEQR